MPLPNDARNYVTREYNQETIRDMEYQTQRCFNKIVHFEREIDLVKDRAKEILVKYKHKEYLQNERHKLSIQRRNDIKTHKEYIDTANRVLIQSKLQNERFPRK